MKKIIVLAVLISAGGSGLFAQDFWGFGNKSSSITMDIITIAVGGGLAAVPLFDSLGEFDYIMYGLGGGIAIIGIIGLIYDLVTPDSSYYATERNPILEHVVLNVSHKTVYVGGTWRF